MKNVHPNPIGCRYDHFQKVSPSDLDLGRKKKENCKRNHVSFFFRRFLLFRNAGNFLLQTDRPNRDISWVGTNKKLFAEGNFN